MEQIKAPFTQEQVTNLNAYQKAGRFHPFTCGSPEEYTECNRINNSGESYAEKQGILIATKEGWVCPCGKYTQNWAHSFMAEKDERNENL